MKDLGTVVRAAIQGCQPLDHAIYLRKDFLGESCIDFSETNFREPISRRWVLR